MFFDKHKITNTTLPLWSYNKIIRSVKVTFYFSWLKRFLSPSFVCTGQDTNWCWIQSSLSLVNELLSWTYGNIWYTCLSQLIIKHASCHQIRLISTHDFSVFGVPNIPYVILNFKSISYKKELIIVTISLNFSSKLSCYYTK